jgi:predicted nucleotidyltransferase
MAPLIENKKSQIAALCERFHVVRLEVFGSAADGGFDPATSDVDFLVEFESLEPGALANAYFGLLESLRELLKRDIDLVTPKSVTNPYLRRAIDESRRTLYAA